MEQGPFVAWRILCFTQTPLVHILTSLENALTETSDQISEYGGPAKKYINLSNAKVGIWGTWLF